MSCGCISDQTRAVMVWCCGSGGRVVKASDRV